MPHLSVGRFPAVFDLRGQRRFNPNTAVRDLVGVGLGLSDQRLEADLSLTDSLLSTEFASASSMKSPGNVSLPMAAALLPLPWNDINELVRVQFVPAPKTVGGRGTNPFPSDWFWQ